MLAGLKSQQSCLEMGQSVSHAKIVVALAITDADPTTLIGIKSQYSTNKPSQYRLLY